MYGKKIRIERILDRKTGNAVIVPMDHGMTYGPLDGINDPKTTVDEVAEGGATAVLMHKGLIPYSYRGYGKDVGLVVHLSASTNMGNSENLKIQVTDVEEAIRYGADAVSVQVNFGTDFETGMLSYVGKISRECNEWGIPLIIMAYPRGPKVKNEYDADAIAHCARASSELGADMVKVSYTGDVDSFRYVCKSALAPVVVAGGPKLKSDLDVLNMVRESMDAGARGVSIGRNIFQNKNIKAMTKAVSSIVLENYTADEAYDLIR